eukprot:4733542-Prymnesium_polylepis.1
MRGGAMYAVSSTVTLTDVSIVRCVCNSSHYNAFGGAMYARSSTVSFIGSSIIESRCYCAPKGNQTGNHFASGGAIYASQSTMALKASSITDSRAFAQEGSFATGGTMYLTSTSVSLTDSSINGSAARSDNGYARGGVIRGIYASTTLTFIRSVVSGGTASDGSDAKIAERRWISYFQVDTSYYNGDASGGFIFISFGVSLTLTNSSIADCSAHSFIHQSFARLSAGGAIDAGQGSTVTLIYSFINGSSVSSSYAALGGAIFAHGQASTATVTLVGSSITGSSVHASSRAEGGAVYVKDSVTMLLIDSSILLSSCISSSLSSGHALAGAIYAMGQTLLTFMHCVIAQSSASASSKAY